MKATESPPSRAELPNRGSGRLIRQALGILPAVIGLGGFFAAAAWGYLHHWKLPPVSQFLGAGPSAVDDWCAEHSVPESACVSCDASGKPFVGHGWCRVHGISECPYEHPDVIQLPETPTVTPERVQAIEAALQLRPRSTNNSRCQSHERRIQVASVETLGRLGIEVEPAAERPVVEEVLVTGEVSFNQNHTAHLSSRVAGTIWRVEKLIGAAVQEGEILALVDAGEVGIAKTEFLQALGDSRLKQRSHSRLAALAAKGSVPGRQVLEAEAASQEADIRLLAARESLLNLGFPVPAADSADISMEEAAEQLRFLGLSPELATRSEAAGASSNLIPIRSPIEGVVVEHHAVVGEVVDTTTRLFTVSDRSRLWVTVDVPQQEARLISLGQTLVFQSDSAEGELLGEISWISDAIDPVTRLLQVRAEVRNDDRQFKAQTFGSGRILLREDVHAVVVPDEAVHSEGCCSIVFVQSRDFLKPGVPKLFEIRKVRLGVRLSGQTEVIAGLWPGELIATRGSEALRVELLKGNLGDGCGCAH